MIGTWKFRVSVDLRRLGMASKFNVGDMVRKRENNTQFLKEEIEGIVVEITHPSWGNPFMRDELHLCLVQDSNGAHYNYVDERWLEASDASKFEPKELHEGGLVRLSPHSTKTILDRGKNYSVKKVDGNRATIMVENKAIKIHVEDLQIVR